VKRFALVVLITLGLAACGGSSKSATPQARPPVDLRGKSAVDIVAQNNAFTPTRLLISSGTKVTWTNKDAVAHDIKATTNTANFGAPFGVGVGQFGPGATYSFTFKNAGQFPYLCTIHGLMTGNIQVG
jgi:plastocyanin